MRSSDTRRPPWSKLLPERPAVVRLLAAQLRRPPGERRDGSRQPVIVVPAFLAPDFPTLPLRRALHAAGHRTWGWGQGVNMGARRTKFARLLDHIDGIAWATDEKIVLIGWSLGGLYAREAAKRRPDKVATVVTLGTPISHILLLDWCAEEPCARRPNSDQRLIGLDRMRGSTTDLIAAGFRTNGQFEATVILGPCRLSRIELTHGRSLG